MFCGIEGLIGLADQPLRILAAAAALIAVKAVLIYGLARLFGVSRASSFESAMLLGPCGEFAFVLFGQAEASGLVAADVSREAALIVAITMMAIPLIARIAGVLAAAIRKPAPLPPEAVAALPADQQPRVIVAGYGRVGHLIGDMLAEHGIPYIAVDADPELVARERRAGRPVYYGDASNAAFLNNCGIAEAPALAVTMDSPARVDDVTRAARALRRDLKIIARARDERHAIRLYGAGVTEAVPETIESSLQLAEALLVEAGIPMGLAIASVHERRDGFRKLLGRPDRRATLDAGAARARRRAALPTRSPKA
jgi:CPA2 family monovalent cation:H+ antiporter-2